MDQCSPFILELLDLKGSKPTSTSIMFTGELRGLFLWHHMKSKSQSTIDIPCYLSLSLSLSLSLLPHGRAFKLLFVSLTVLISMCFALKELQAHVLLGESFGLMGFINRTCILPFSILYMMS